SIDCPDRNILEFIGHHVTACEHGQALFAVERLRQDRTKRSGGWILCGVEERKLEIERLPGLAEHQAQLAGPHDPDPGHGSTVGGRVELRQHRLRLSIPVCLQGVCDALVAERKDGRGEQCSVDRSCLSDRHAAYGNTRRHLGDGQQRIHALQGFRTHRYTDHGQARFRGGHARKMRSTAGARDNDFEPALHSARGVLEQEIGRPVRRDDLYVAGDSEFLKNIRGVFHRLPVGARAHDYAYRCARRFAVHCSPVLPALVPASTLYTSRNMRRRTARFAGSLPAASSSRSSAATRASGYPVCTENSVTAAEPSSTRRSRHRSASRNASRESWSWRPSFCSDASIDSACATRTGVSVCCCCRLCALRERIFLACTAACGSGSWWGSCSSSESASGVSFSPRDCNARCSLLRALLL